VHRFINVIFLFFEEEWFCAGKRAEASGRQSEGYVHAR